MSKQFTSHGRLITVRMTHGEMGDLDLDVDAKGSVYDLTFDVKSGDVVDNRGKPIRELTAEEIIILNDDDGVAVAVGETLHDVVYEDSQDPELDS